MGSFNANMLLGIVTAIVAVLLWDTWLYLNWGYVATISGVIWHCQVDFWWAKWVALAVFLFLWWHWFWGKRNDNTT